HAKAKIEEATKRYKTRVERYETDPATGEGKKELLAKAKEWEAMRDRATERDPNFDFAEALFQIAIVLGSVSIVAASRALVKLSGGLAVVASLLMINGYFLLVHLPMRAEPGGWFALTTNRAGAGARYRYVVDGNAYPDPASRSQPEGVHGASEVVDPGAYAWTASGWRGRSWEEIVLYELHLGTFSQTGDFAGAIAHLVHIRDLGATAVELMPIAEFPGTRGWGYDGTYLYAPSSRYGRPEDLKRL